MEVQVLSPALPGSRASRRSSAGAGHHRRSSAGVRGTWIFRTGFGGLAIGLLGRGPEHCLGTMRKRRSDLDPGQGVLSASRAGRHGSAPAGPAAASRVERYELAGASTSVARERARLRSCFRAPLRGRRVVAGPDATVFGVIWFGALPTSTSRPRLISVLHRRAWGCGPDRERVAVDALGRPRRPDPCPRRASCSPGPRSRDFDRAPEGIAAELALGGSST